MIDPPSSYKYEKNKFISSMILHLHIKIVNENISELQIFSITLTNGVPYISSIQIFSITLKKCCTMHIFKHFKCFTIQIFSKFKYDVPHISIYFLSPI
jgi:hypothetical protein